MYKHVVKEEEGEKRGVGEGSKKKRRDTLAKKWISGGSSPLFWPLASVSAEHEQEILLYVYVQVCC